MTSEKTETNLVIKQTLMNSSEIKTLRKVVFMQIVISLKTKQKN